MSNEFAFIAKQAISGIREGLDAGKEAEQLVQDVDKFVTSEAQARAAMRRKAQVVKGDITFVNAVDEWRKLKEIHDLEQQLKADIIKKHGAAEWGKIEVIKARLLKEAAENKDAFGRDVKEMRLLFWKCMLAAFLVMCVFYKGGITHWF
jgi:hypothetical protein